MGRNTIKNGIRQILRSPLIPLKRCNTRDLQVKFKGRVWIRKKKTGRCLALCRKVQYFAAAVTHVPQSGRDRYSYWNRICSSHLSTFVSSENLIFVHLKYWHQTQLIAYSECLHVIVKLRQGKQIDVYLFHKPFLGLKFYCICFADGPPHKFHSTFILTWN